MMLTRHPDTFFLTELRHDDFTLRSVLQRWPTSAGIGGPLHRKTHHGTEALRHVGSVPCCYGTNHPVADGLP